MSEVKRFHMHTGLQVRPNLQPGSPSWETALLAHTLATTAATCPQSRELLTTALSTLQSRLQTRAIGGKDITGKDITGSGRERSDDLLDLNRAALLSMALREEAEPAAAVQSMHPRLAQARLAEVVKQAWLTAGKPALRKLASDVRVSHSTLSRIFNGMCRPKAPVLSGLAEVLGVRTADFQKVWRPLWEASFRAPASDDADDAPASADLPAVAEAPEPAVVEASTCPRCGGPYTDLNQHIGWHVQIEQASARTEPHPAQRLRAVPDRS